MVSSNEHDSLVMIIVQVVKNMLVVMMVKTSVAVVTVMVEKPIENSSEYFLKKEYLHWRSFGRKFLF